MKIMTKRFLVAVCLLVVSATLLGSASFAWFSMNTNVNVDGIEVVAYSDALFLEISETGADDSYDTAITLANAKKTLRVVTQKKLANGYRITEVDIANAQYVDGTFYVTTSDTTYVTGTTYYEPGYETVTTLVNGDDVSGLFVASGNVYVQAGDKVYNEEENVIPMSEALVAELEKLPQYDYEILFIDNCSLDTTREKLRDICAKNKKIRAIFNSKNFAKLFSKFQIRF